LKSDTISEVKFKKAVCFDEGKNEVDDNRKDGLEFVVVG
jgi:hypothetical protein